MNPEEIDLLFVVLPAIVGLLVVTYVWLRVIAAWTDFFRSLRGWTIVAMVTALGLFWVGELLAWTDSVAADSGKPVADLGLVIFSSWLAVCMAALGTKYRRLNHINDFKAWFSKHPINMVSAWGLAGIAFLMLTAAIDSRGSGDGEMIWIVLPAGIYLLASMQVVGINHVRRPTGSGAGPRTGKGAPNMILIAISWILIPAIVLTLAVPRDLESSLVEYDPSSWLLVLLLGVLASAMSMTRFVALAIDPEVEGVRREGFREYDIPRGAYLIHDEKNDAAFALFSELTTLPLRPDAVVPGADRSATDTLQYLIPQGLIVTREFPDKVRQKHSLLVTPIIWLTETPGERRIAPTSLSILTDTIVRFMETNPNSIVLLEGVEYVCTFNEFKKVLRFLDALNEEAWITKARLILTVHPKAFDMKDLALLERDRNVVHGMSGVEDLKIESRIPVASQ